MSTNYSRNIILAIILTFLCAVPIFASDAADFNKALALYKIGDMKSAKELLLKLSGGRLKNDPTCHYYLANVLSHLGEMSEAKTEYRRTLLLHPGPDLARYCQQALGTYHAPTVEIVGAPVENGQGYVGLKMKKTDVMEVFPESPAEKGGVRTGDKIITINETAIEGLKTPAIAKLLTGPIGSTVNILLEHQGQRRYVVLVRAKPGESLSKALIEQESKKETRADSSAELWKP